MRKMVEERHYELPRGLDLNELILKNAGTKELRHINKYKFVVELIYRLQCNENEFVNISRRYLRKSIPKNDVLVRVISNLLEWNVVECDFEKIYFKKKRIGVKAYGYRIKSNYFFTTPTNTTTNIPYITDKTSINPFSLEDFSFRIKYNLNNKVYLKNILSNNININQYLSNAPFFSYTASVSVGDVFNVSFRESNSSSEKENEIDSKSAFANQENFIQLYKDKNSPEFKFISDNIKKLKMDESTYKWIDEMVKSKMQLRPKKIDIDFDNQHFKIWDKKPKLTKNKAIYWKRAAKNIDSKNVGGSVSLKTNRLYNSITSLPSELKHFLRYRDIQLYYIDIKNCQPFMFLHYVLKNHEETEDILLYKELVCKGMLYEFMMNQLGRLDLIDVNFDIMTDKQIKEYKIERSIFKINFFAKIFFSNENRKFKERRVFEKHFPTVSKIVSSLKSKHYADLAIELQKIEAKVILNGVIRKLAVQFPDKMAVTIHDAIICEESLVDVITEAIRKECEAIIGAIPNLSVEKL